MIDNPPKPRKTLKDEAPTGWTTQLKYDGTRQFLIIEDGEARLLNKRGNEKTRHFPEVTQNTDLPDDTIIDGEMTIIDKQHPHGNLPLLQKRDGGKPAIRRDGSENFKANLLRKQYPATFIGFDLLRVAGEDYTDTAQRQRHNKLTEILSDTAQSVKTAQVFTDISDGWGWVKENSAEGLVIKHPDKPYPSGRTGHWKKIKNTTDTIVTATNYETHRNGIVAEVKTPKGQKNHRININGWRADKVKNRIENGEARIEITYLEKSDNDRYREPTFKRLVK